MTASLLYIFIFGLAGGYWHPEYYDGPRPGVDPMGPWMRALLIVVGGFAAIIFARIVPVDGGTIVGAAVSVAVGGVVSGLVGLGVTAGKSRSAVGA